MKKIISICKSIKNKIDYYITNHFITDTEVKTDVSFIVNIMKEGFRLGKEESKFTEWSEEDDGLLELTVAAIKDFYDNKNPLRYRLIDWLKSLKLQLKNEWSKEDEEIRITTLSFLYEFKKEGYENAVECIDWLKSLKPQNRWKLDVDQLDALHDMIASYEVCSKDHNKEKILELVKSLYYSLEK